MSSTWQPRGPLPARVYWVRRGLVVLVALVLVFAVARVLATFGGDDGGGDTAATAAQRSDAQRGPTPSVPSAVTSVGPSVATGSTGSTPSASPTSAPTGACDDADVLVQPDVTTVTGGRTARLTMALTTPGEACTWTATPKTLAVKITSGKDRVWSSQDCPASIPKQSVVVRPASQRPATVAVAWGTHRSVSGCQKGQAWAKPGWYHVVAASLGGDPQDVQFRLVAPAAPVRTASPSAKPSDKPSGRPSAKPSGKPSKKASSKPSGKPSAKPSKKPSAKPTR